MAIAYPILYVVVCRSGTRQHLLLYSPCPVPARHSIQYTAAPGKAANVEWSINTFYNTTSG